MEDEANQVVQPLVVAKGVVAAFVGDDPDSGEDTTLDSPVEGPGEEGEVVGEGVEVVYGGIGED